MTNAAGMPCPVCRVPLVMSDRQGVEIDYCPQCRGVWLDRGELDKIIERSIRTDPMVQPQPQVGSSAMYDRSHGTVHQQPWGRGHPKRRKSFLEELFD
jgi:Zn-finger nucleic acid-binding protein